MRRAISTLVRSPVTATLAVAALIFASVIASRQSPNIVFAELLDQTGAVTRQTAPDAQELSGLFRLWELQLWRVPATALIHGDFVVALLSIGLFAFVGSCLEPRWGSFAVLWIWSLTTLAGFAVAWIVQETPLGLFTGACGLIFAAFRCQVMHPDQPPLLPSRVITGTAVGIFVVGSAAYLGFLPAPYIAWVTAMAVGWSLGASLKSAEPDSSPQFAWKATPASRTLPWTILAGLYLATHPFWLGTYYWRLSRQETSLARREALLQKAVRVSPELTGAQIERIETIEKGREPHRAWEQLARAMADDRRNERLQSTARSLWERFATDGDRRVARETLWDVFGKEAAAWERRLELPVTNPELADGTTLEKPASDESAAERFPLDQAIELPATLDGSPERAPRPLQLPPPKLDDPNSAAEGRTL